MKLLMTRFVILLALPGILFLAGCASSGNGSVSVHGSVSYGVYGGYGYPGYGYGGYPYRPGVPVNPGRPDLPDRPDRPAKPDRPSTKPAHRPSGNMGRPSRMSGGRRR